MALIQYINTIGKLNLVAYLYGTLFVTKINPQNKLLFQLEIR